jgi:glutamate formiminotransferase
MSKIIECVPNFSEGRRPEIIDKIVSAILSVQGIVLLDKEMNADHNRAVVSFIGEPPNIVEAAFQGCKKASELIDLTIHQGEHPRMGATDVIPFIPISNVTMEECVYLAKELGRRIADELKIPVYLYEAAATRAHCIDLANIRKGEFEGLKTAIKTDPTRAPDFGKPELHPTAGATVVGARFPLIAYNINLNTTDLSIAKKIAKAIRFRDGGFRYTKALGFAIKEKNCVQVSINMTNYLGTPLFRVFETVKREAERYGVTIKESEIVGLTPEKALIDSALYYLQLDEFKPEQILESKLEEGKSKGIEDFLYELSQPTPTPGGGSCAALSGAIGASLLLMVTNITLAKPESDEIVKEFTPIKETLAKVQKRFYEYISLDAESFNMVMQAYKLPKATDEEKAKRTEAIQLALKEACAIPEKVFDLAVETIFLCHLIAAKGNKNTISDVGVAVSSFKTAMEGGRLNVLINLKTIRDRNFIDEKISKIEKSLSAVENEIAEINRTIENKL